MARLQAIGEVVGQLDEELLLLLAEQPWLVAANDQRTGLIPPESGKGISRRERNGRRPVWGRSWKIT